MAKFFINRPIFAAVISVVITLAGGIAVDAAAGGAVSRDHAADSAGELHLSRALAARSWPKRLPLPSSSR